MFFFSLSYLPPFSPFFCLVSSAQSGALSAYFNVFVFLHPDVGPGSTRIEPAKVAALPLMLRVSRFLLCFGIAVLLGMHVERSTFTNVEIRKLPFFCPLETINPK